MTEIEIARERVIAASLSLVATQAYIGVNGPKAYDDSELELRFDSLNWELRKWAWAVLEGPNPDWLDVNRNGEVG